MRRPGSCFARLVPLMLALGCTERAATPPAAAETTTARWGSAPNADEREGPNAPLAPRRVRLDPAAYEDTERICAIVFKGPDEELGAIAARAYDPPRVRRSSIRCTGASGTGWADLVFDEASRDLADLVAEGQRLRVRVERGRGHRGRPILSFVALQTEPRGEAPRFDPRGLAPPLDDATPDPAAGVRDEGADALLAEVPVGANWTTLEAPSELPHACAVEGVGEPDPVPTEGGYAPEVTHHLPVFCRGPAGPVRVDVTFAADQRLAALRLRRGEVVPLTPVVRTESGVRAQYAGP